MKTMSLDTSHEVQQMIFAMLREAPTSKKIALTFDLIQTTRLLVLAGLRRRFPAANEDELRKHMISKLLPRAAVIKAYGFDPHETDF